MLSTAPTRSGQAIEAFEPRLVRLAESIRAAFGLAAEDVVLDSLVACGLGDPTPDEVAACAERFVRNVRARSVPSTVLVVGRQTAALARLAGLAGLVTNDTWHPLGTLPARLLVAETEQEAITKLGVHWGVVPKRSASSHVDLSQWATQLFQVLGASAGRAVMKAEGKWCREKTRALSVGDVTEHLAGRALVGAFRPKGAWPFVVLDVDRHDAIQESCFGQTVQRLRTLFPSSFVVQSSSSGGVHFYIRLPDNWRYENAALWMRAYLLLEDLRFAEVTSPTGKRVRSELVEVKNHPPRLPFGFGSVKLGSSLPPQQQLQEFINWVGQSNSSEFTNAVKRVQKEVPVPRRWSRSTRQRLARWVLNKEAGVASGRRARATPGDPWEDVLPNLPQHLHAVVIDGVPAYGTRSHWTSALIDALSVVVDKPTARALLRHWLTASDRVHQSEDIENDLPVVLKATDKLVRDHYRRVRGVPERIWNQIGRDVDAALSLARTGTNAHVRGTFPKLTHRERLSADEVYATAFFIARGFFEVGKQKRQVPEHEFAQFGGKNVAHAIQEVLSYRMTWLRLEAKAVQGQTAKVFSLRYWPAIPGEKTLVVPPGRLPRRRHV